MSDHREQIVDVSRRRPSAESMAEVTAWLVATGWAEARIVDADWLANGNDTHPLGSRATSLSPGIEGGTVTVAWHDDHAWYAGEGAGPPSCRQCGTEATERDFDLAVPGWGLEAEPDLRCPGCGAVARIGDWDLSGSVAFGNPGIVLDTDFGGDIALELAREIELAIDGRWRWIHLHI